MKTRACFCFLFLAASLLLPHSRGQVAVDITARFDTNRIPLGAKTTLRVYAQVVPALRPQSDRIFSWYIDLLNIHEIFAEADYSALVKPTSDKHPDSSSTGTDDGLNRTGIYDTFLETTDAGVSEPVELLSVPVTGTGAGTARFQVRAGTGVPSLDLDFIVAPLTGGDFFSGSDYSNAFDDLTVLEVCNLRLNIRRSSPDNLELTFNPCEGFIHTLEMKSALADGEQTWQPLPGAPHDAGVAIIPNPSSNQYFRVRRVAPTDL